MCDGLILGYGNPLCSDDGVGWRVVEALAHVVPQGWATETVYQLTPEWAEPISRAAVVIFVDAAVGDCPGEVCDFPLVPAAGRAGSHEATPEGLLAMAQELFGRCPPAHMVTITGGSFAIAETLTPAVEAAVPVAVERITVFLDVVEATQSSVL